MVVYLVQNEVNLYSCELRDYFWITCLIYLTVPFLLTLVSLRICKLLSKSKIPAVNSIEPANNDFLTGYLAFFFVALSIQTLTTFWVVFGMMFIFIFWSRVSFFNPIFLIYGYHPYYVTTKENVKIMLISKRKLKNPASFEPITVRRINDYIFIEIK